MWKLFDVMDRLGHRQAPVVIDTSLGTNDDNSDDADDGLESSH